MGGKPIDQIRPQQQRAITLLLTSPGNLENVAAEASVSPRTLRRWMHEDMAFRKALRRADEEVVAATARSLTALAQLAIDNLTEVIQSPEATPGEKSRAANIVLRWALPYRDHAIMSDRIERITRYIEETRI